MSQLRFNIHKKTESIFILSHDASHIRWRKSGRTGQCHSQKSRDRRICGRLQCLSRLPLVPDLLSKRVNLGRGFKLEYRNGSQAYNEHEAECDYEIL